MHISIPINSTVEFINVTEVSPLISKCEIKVCYVGQDPNRNNTVITKEVATEIGRKLPGSPIVGFYNEETGDFEQHNKEIEISNGQLKLKDVTKPYGFVDINAKVWFQKFLDDGNIEREYLVTEGYIWTEAYPESKRIITQGNNQSMELYKESVKGSWSKNENFDNRFFIINEAIVEKLCILGTNFEPCFEGSQIKVSFSLDEDFNTKMYSMMNELKNALEKGGSEESMEHNEVVETVVIEEPIVTEEPAATEETPIVEEPEIVIEEPEVTEDPVIETEPEVVEDPVITEDPATDEPEVIEEPVTTEEPVVEEVPVQAEFNLEEVEEYVNLRNDYEDLQVRFSALEQENAGLKAEMEPLKVFKLQSERADKEAMINSFYMLSDEDKADVVANIDSYSVDDIEAKLAVICVRNKINLNTEEDTNAGLVYNLSNAGTASSIEGLPAWVQAVKRTAQKNQ